MLRQISISRARLSPAASALGGRPRFALRPFSATSLLQEVVKVPQMAESISEGTLKQWLKQKGDYVEADEEVATIETDKIDVSVNAPKAGVLKELFANEEDTVEVGQDLFDLGEGEKPAESSKPKQEEQPSKKEESEPKKDEGKQQEEPKPAPKEDKKPEQPKPQQESKPAPSSSSSQSKQQEPQQSSAPSNRGETRVKMNSMRKRIAERLKQSQNTAASLTTFNEIDMTNIMKLRSTYKDRILKDKGVKLGFMSAFAKAACIALKEFPAANAQIEGSGPGDTIVYKDYVDLSVAVATPKGLVTPVVRNAESMSFIEIEQAIADLGKKARDNKLTLEDMSGGTFTISNGGVFGSLFGTPIINLPQAAVLGMHATKQKPWVVDGKVEVRPIMVIALTYDHRLLDGREAVSVLVRIKELIEDPGFMLLQ